MGGHTLRPSRPTTTPRPTWHAFEDALGHALVAKKDRTYACGLRVRDVRFERTPAAKCADCLAAVGLVF